MMPMKTIGRIDKSRATAGSLPGVEPWSFEDAHINIAVPKQGSTAASPGNGVVLV